MENNGIVTGHIPVTGDGVHKTYEESFLSYLSDNEVVKIFYYPKAYGIYYKSETDNIEALKRDEIDSDKYVRLEIINVSVLGSRYVFELIDANVLHSHLVEEAYQRNIMLDSYQKSL